MTRSERSKYDSFVEQVKAERPNAREPERDAYTLWLKWKVLTDLYFFGTEIMGWKDAKQGRRRRVDPKLHKWLARVLQIGSDVLILIPRLHLKTTWVKLRIVQRVLQNPNIRIVLVSKTSALVRDELKDIVRMFCHPMVRALFPSVVPAPGKRYSNWEKATEDELTIKRDPSLGHVPQEPQIRVVGIESNVTGMHFDEGYVDDVIDKDTVKTVEQMKKVEDWWRYFQSLIELGSTVVMTGTFYHPNDLYHMIWREKHFERVYIRKAIENGKPLYSTWFTLKGLEKIRKRQGNSIFNSQYMLDPYPDEEKMMPAPYPTFDHLPPGKYRFYIALDPAATTNTWSDESGFAVGAVNQNNQLFILESFGVKMKGEKIIELLIKKFLQYDKAKVGVELGLQEHLTSIFEMKRAQWETENNRPLGLKLNPIKISRSKSKGERVNLSLGAAMREGKVLIRETLTDLMREMEFFTGRGNEKDNLVDSASMLFSVCESFAQHYWAEQQFVRNSQYTLNKLFKKRRVGGWEERFAS